VLLAEKLRFTLEGCSDAVGSSFNQLWRSTPHVSSMFRFHQRERAWVRLRRENYERRRKTCSFDPSRSESGAPLAMRMREIEGEDRVRAKKSISRETRR
jgi:hypothetical protein